MNHILVLNISCSLLRSVILETRETSGLFKRKTMVSACLCRRSYIRISFHHTCWRGHDRSLHFGKVRSCTHRHPPHSLCRQNQDGIHRSTWRRDPGTWLHSGRGWTRTHQSPFHSSLLRRSEKYCTLDHRANLQHWIWKVEVTGLKVLTIIWRRWRLWRLFECHLLEMAKPSSITYL